MNVDPRLKPCPFCKGKGECRVNFLNQWLVACQNCRAVMWGDSRDEAIENWNRRADDDGT